jgi:hypothetical protein
MTGLTREEFQGYWEATEVIREYETQLFTFGDMTLPYIYAASHDLGDRTFVRRGTVFLKRPTFILPFNSGLNLGSGFQSELPQDLNQFFRLLKIPYSDVTRKIEGEERLEYGRLREVVSNLDRELAFKGDSETGLIRGLNGGEEASLVRYCFGLVAKSGEGNINEYVEHLKRQRRGSSIMVNEEVTEEDLRRLFE